MVGALAIRLFFGKNSNGIGNRAEGQETEIGKIDLGHSAVNPVLLLLPGIVRWLRHESRNQLHRQRLIANLSPRWLGWKQRHWQ
jgi:hypothetical protein